MTEELLAHLKRQEGFVGHVYHDVAGVPTVGYGHALKPGEDFPSGVTESEAVALLEKDAANAEAAALRMSPCLATEPAPRLAAITDFIYNCGGAAYNKSTLRYLVNQQQWSKAAASLRLWVKAHDPQGRAFTVPALVKRRAITSRWLEYPNDSVLPPAA